jgi:predicted dithiol-disulfide oxidoreductase (DUF899 family)
MVALAKSSETLYHLHFPNESAAYRRARNALLDEEVELRRQIERVAAQRRALPPGGELAEDYVFEAAGAQRQPVKVKLSELFAPGKDTLAIYSFMFGPERERPCPGCTHFLDGLDGAVRHTRERFSFAVVAKSPLPRILAFADERGWRHLRLLSTAGNSYDRDYFGDSTALSPGMRKQQEFKPGEEWDMPILIGAAWRCRLRYLPRATAAARNSFSHAVREWRGPMRPHWRRTSSRSPRTAAPRLPRCADAARPCGKPRNSWRPGDGRWPDRPRVRSTPA